jgi:hypothetical protein
MLPHLYTLAPASTGQWGEQIEDKANTVRCVPAKRSAAPLDTCRGRANWPQSTSMFAQRNLEMQQRRPVFMLGDESLIVRTKI